MAWDLGVYSVAGTLFRGGCRYGRHRLIRSESRSHLIRVFYKEIEPET